MKSMHDYFGEYHAAARRRRRAIKRANYCDCPECCPECERLEQAYWERREALRAARDRKWGLTWRDGPKLVLPPSYNCHQFT